MKTPHKHAEVLRAIAEGEEVQYQKPDSLSWSDYRQDGTGYDPLTYRSWAWRIKPEPKPDVVLFYFVGDNDEKHEDGPDVDWTGTLQKCNLHLTFDGETGKLKSAEVV